MDSITEKNLNKFSSDTKLKLTGKLLQKAPSQSKFTKSSAPLHVPHSSCFKTHNLIKSESTEILNKFREKEKCTNVVKTQSFELQKKLLLERKKSESNVLSLKSNIKVKHSVDKDKISVTDLNKLIEEKIKKFKDNSFVYLTYTVSNHSEFFTPYSLSEVPYKHVDKTQFYTVSRHGVTYWSQTENHFTKLDDWQQEYNKYRDLMKIKSFYNFRIWKGFKVWQKTIQWKKFFAAKNFLDENLFITTPPLARAILKMREEFCCLIDLDFVDNRIIEDWHLFYFIEAQMATFEKTRDLLNNFRERMKLVIYEACFKALIDKGFSPDDEALLYPNLKKLKEMMNFTDYIRKRRYCILLSRFLNLCDYITITLLHTMLQSSFEKLSSIFRIHNKYSPDFDELKTMVLDVDLEKPRPIIQPQTPFIKGELVLKQKSIEVDPSRKITNEIFKQLVDLFLAAIYNVDRFQSDIFFNQFTEPSIMGRQEDRLCGNPPDLEFILVDDIELQDNKQVIFDIINEAYDKVEIYIKRFDPIRLDYDIDLTTDPKVIKNEREVDKLRAYCARYVKEMNDLEGILSHCNLGLLQLKQNTFKEEIIPVCRSLLTVLDGHLPTLAIERVNSVKEKAENIMFRLQAMPENTLQFVNFLRYSDQCLSSIEKLDVELKYAYYIFHIMKDYQIFVDEQEKENYFDCEDLISETKATLEIKLEQKSELIQKLSDCLQEDITKVFEEVDDVQKEAVQDWFIQEESDPIAVKDALQLLLDRLSICHNLSQDYRKYQKEFRIDVTRFDTLDLVIKDVKQRQLLWLSVDEWTEAIKEWQEINFHQIVLDDLINLNTKILKNCTMLEKNLPRNKIVPKLRISAETFKEKLPTIGFLRNPALKMRHWLKIEQVLNKKLLQDEKLCLKTFEDVNAFDLNLSEEIMEVSGQASAEAGLEVLLKKVESSWKEFELTIVQHRETKDVFILGGVEELQTTLDESNIIINTIAASRHVGPIKPRVDEWIRLLDLFGETLEEWMTCQQSWIYLEAIFSAPDIQRQLPNEARMFLVVDKTWKEIMRSANKMPLALPNMTEPKILPKMKNNNMLLEKISRCLEAYLEVKRVAFPRFYFLSNDELLEILAQTKNPHAVQPHLRKCFDAISKLEFGSKDMGDGILVLTTDIVAMISPEDERVVYGKGLKARGSVEDWLCKVEQAMFIALKRCMKYAYQCYVTKDRSIWFQEHPNQMVLTVSQQQWATDVHGILDGDIQEEVLENMKKYEQKSLKDLQKLASIARSNISKLLRRVLCALITIDVHAIDTITNLVKQKVVKSTDFNWLKMLRYYWVNFTETMEAKMASATLPYFYEYLGAGGVLVITPLTDRCYLCLMGALQMDLGGAPAGPAGTGKTETTKDLAKALAKQCVVFNCSEGLDYKMMGRFFSGLSQAGSWCCFDEFNRIDIEVLSVIAQQLITIRTAKLMRQKRFMFEGREIKLEMSCAAFITMNPGYAGRTELPDNLKALFRPMSMMVPDYALIAEVILYSEGFEGSKLLAQKMVQMYKLCSEQLSQQDHYDFGMRAVKSVLVMAGTLKRSAPNQREDITLIAALRDSNLPKFLVEDAKLFKGILSDLFPGVELPVGDYGELQLAIEHSMIQKKLQTVPDLIVKTIQLYDTMCVRWGVMLVGPTGGGKTCVLHALADALSKLYADNVPGPNYRHVKIQTLNPKSVSLDELYGAVNTQTLEWRDGLLGLAVRAAVVVTEEEHQWVVCDGPVDAVWIENMNTVLDDNKMLCLANSERIKLSNWVHMVFEVQDLSQASPATVSRCGMVYVDPSELGWVPLVMSWRQSIPNEQLLPEFSQYVYDLFNLYLDNILKYANRYCFYTIHQVDVSKVSMICTLIQILIKEAGDLNIIDKTKGKNCLCKLFIWSTLWSIGGNFNEDSRKNLEEYIRKIVETNSDIELPEGTLWDFKINPKTKEWENWSAIVPNFDYKADVPYFDLLVPTSDTVRFGYVAELLLQKRKPVLFTGDTGVGKSVLARSVLTSFSKEKIISVIINFSAQTSSPTTQEMLESRLEKRKKTLLGPPMGKTLIVFVDDVNMPKLDMYGSQPPIELLRQFLDFNGVYDREKMFWKGICDVVLGAACAPPGGGRNALTPRFVRHFALLQLPPPNSKTLLTIFNAIMIGFLSDFNSVVRPLAEPIIQASVDIYETISRELLPTPAKSHYVFNLRDLSKCVQGVLQADSSNYNTTTQITRLFYHESMRVFHDRLINYEDKSYFKELMSQTCSKHFKEQIVKDNETLLFGDFILFGQSKEDRVYEEIKDLEKLKSVLMDYLEDYNGSTGKEMKLILFQDAIEHITRLARLLRAERGNGLLVGLSGMGKQSLSRLATHLNGYKCFQIELCRGYDHIAFHEDLRKLYWTAGVLNNPTVFLITDTQIVKEAFLEDINNILNSGEVPNLFESDEYEKVILTARQDCIKEHKDCSRDEVYNFFINRVRANLHLIICMSPIGDAFRRRCRMFPSLVNCSTIDWFVKWPPEALYSVALGSLHEITENEEQCQNLSKICVTIHESVEKSSEDLYREMRRHYYTTPSSYLELLKLYHSLLKKRADFIEAKRTRIANGLNKILETNELVVVMGEDLQKFVPILEERSHAMKELLIKLDKDSEVADAVRTNVTIDETAAKIKAADTQEIADDASKDLEIAMPALRAAQDALKGLNKSDVNELRSFQVPPKLVQFVMEPICILLGAKPDWPSAKTVMADVNFLKRLVEFDKEHISDKTLLKLKSYINHKDFDPAVVEKVSKVCKSMCLWVKAMDEYAKIYKVVEPKIRRYKGAEAELKEVMAVLRQKQSELAEIEGKMQSLKDMIEEKSLEYKIIKDNFDTTTGRLNRAGRLTSALYDEEVRWKESVENLTKELWAIPGDVLVASACVAYLGAFSINYRKVLASAWVKDCKILNIPSSAEFNLLSVLGDPFLVRCWNMNGLPKDEISVENGIIVTQALRWPLMIDPQEQANRWIRNMEKENDLKIIKMTDPNLMRILEVCIRQGFPLLLEEIEETIDPTLGPILGREIIVQGGRLLIKLGDTDVDYDPKFKLYMTTKLANPHYLPEVCIQVTLVNFLVTVSGLEDQLLADVVAIEMPELEKQRSDLIVRINADRQQLLNLEDKVLKLLFSSEGNILDDEELVETLNEAKETSAIIAARLIDTEKTEAVITTTREKYRPLAARGANLFFVVASLAEIDPMYQNSLKYFSQVFCSVIQAKHEKLVLEERLKMLMDAEIYAIYENISRGLFEKHKLIYSFLLAISVSKELGNITENEFQFILRGPIGKIDETKIKPESLSLTNYQWKCCLYLEQEYKQFEGLCEDVGKLISINIDDFHLKISFAHNTLLAAKNWNEILSPFQKLMIINSLQDEKLVVAIGSFVRTTIGKRFTESSKNNTLAKLFLDTTSTTPLVFVLSTGSDPMSALIRFAQEMSNMEKLHSISLGQGQGPAAESLIDKGRTLGHWIFLQNCHLATSWMASMEKIIRDMALGVTSTHKDFRLFLSSMPTKSFPVSVLQNSLKITNEPPKGLKANLMRSLGDITKGYFEHHILQQKWRAMVFGICMFHGVLLERRKFGPLGWNITYEFTESDRECGLKVLDMFCEREKPDQKIPWASLEYINGEITWGGRVTDYWDQRCLKTILKIFSSEKILQPEYVYSPSGIYASPSVKTLEEFRLYVANLPFNDVPEIFGMHENANIVFESKETQFFIGTLLEGQPRTSEGGTASATDDICLGMIDNISKALTEKILRDDMKPELIELDSKGRVPSLTTVLIQEIERYNKLLDVVYNSLVNLRKAIKGFVVMSENLEAIFLAFLNNHVPGLWASKGFLSTKSLANWVIDFQYRIDYIQKWIVKGLPCSSWLSGLYFPQSFLTGTLQSHARKHNLPIDSLKVDFEVLNETISQQAIYEYHLDGAIEGPEIYMGLNQPETGVYIHGLFIEAGRWDSKEGGLCDSRKGELLTKLPVVWLKPCLELNINQRYESPLYKTPVRAGVLSTTGHSTNFVLAVLLETKKSPDFWVLRGTALLTMGTD